MNRHSRFSLCPAVFLLVFCVLGVNAWSLTINLTGVVKSSLGPVINAASVKLMHNGASTYTLKTGAFSFTGTGTIQTAAGQPEYAAPFFVQGDRLHFSTTVPGEKVTMKFFDVQGGLLQTVAQTFSSAGPQEIGIGLDKRATGIHFVSFRSESTSGSFSSLKSGADLFCSKTGAWSIGGTAKNNGLAKTEAVYVDTVKVTRTNFRTAIIPISTYMLAMDTIVLQLIDTCLPAITASSDAHGAGTDCMAAGCHIPGNCGPGTPNPTAPVVTACGTLYSAVTGGTPVAGATIRLIDSLGNIATLNTSPTGVFWIGTDCGGYTYGGCVANDSTTHWTGAAATKCPNVAKMTGKASGHCGACHNSTNQIHLP